MARCGAGITRLFMAPSGFRRTGGEEWLGLHLSVAKGTPSPTEKRIPQVCLRRIALLCPVYEKDHRAGAYGCLVRCRCSASYHIAVRGCFLPCATNTLANTRQGYRIAQAALNLCGSLEQRRDLATCPSFTLLNGELAACEWRACGLSHIEAAHIEAA